MRRASVATVAVTLPAEPVMATVALADFWDAPPPKVSTENHPHWCG